MIQTEILTTSRRKINVQGASKQSVCPCTSVMQVSGRSADAECAISEDGAHSYDGGGITFSYAFRQYPA
jgi:hypothetical protein